MRQSLILGIVFVVTVFPALAQRGGGMRGGAVHGGGFRGGGFNTFHGFGGGFGHRPVFRGNFGFRGFGGFGYYPSYYPSLYGGYGFYNSNPYFSYPYQYPYAASYGGPSVVIISDNNYGAPMPAAPVQPAPAIVREPAPPPESRNYEEPLYLVAFKDHTIRAVLAYWVEGGALHYVSLDHEQQQSPLASIDHELSERLNRERNVTFRLPGNR